VLRFYPEHREQKLTGLWDLQLWAKELRGGVVVNKTFH